MQQVKIYIETDSSSPKATEKHYGYVLEVMVSGQAVTREGFGKITGTYHQTVLTEPGKHEYTGWLQGEIEKRKRDNDGIQDHDHEISADVSKNDKKAVR